MTHYNAGDVVSHSITMMFIQDERLSDDGDFVATLRGIARDHAESFDYIPDINGLYPLQVTFGDTDRTSVVINLKPMGFDKQTRELTWWCAAITPDEVGILAALPAEVRTRYIASLVRMTDSQRDLFCKVHGGSNE